MKDAATTEELKDAFEDHLYQTQKHVSRLEKSISVKGTKPKAKCETMEGLTKEAGSIIKETEEMSMTRDAALIIAAQKVEHYEIASLWRHGAIGHYHGLATDRRHTSIKHSRKKIQISCSPTLPRSLSILKQKAKVKARLKKMYMKMPSRIHKGCCYRRLFYHYFFILTKKIMGSKIK